MCQMAGCATQFHISFFFLLYVMIDSDVHMYIIADKPTVILKTKQHSKHDLFGFIISTKINFLAGE
jgi:hypothetical protein